MAFHIASHSRCERPTCEGTLRTVTGAWDTITWTVAALSAQPVALFMAVVAALFAIAAGSPSIDHRGVRGLGWRISMVVLSVISAFTAWAMITGWRWRQ